MDSVNTAEATLPPQRIGEYEVVRKLGAGGMAETFEAVRRRDGGFEKRVAIKRINYPNFQDESFREQFVLEAHLLAQLDHANIVDAYDYDVDASGRRFLVMELVDGLDLSKLLAYYSRIGRKVPPALVAHIGAEVAEALHYLHHFKDREGTSFDIVHRDVSPANILISKHGAVKLADLGIAKFSGRPKHTETNQTKGKLWYLSPEHIEPHRGLEGRSDLFSLGCVLYEALAGALPFRQSTESATFFAILQGKFEPLLDLAPHLDAPFAGLIEELLSPDKTARPRHGNELAFRLRALAPHGSPKAALADIVASAVSDTQAIGGTPSSSVHFTGDPLERAREIASAFKGPSTWAPSIGASQSLTAPAKPLPVTRANTAAEAVATTEAASSSKPRRWRSRSLAAIGAAAVLGALSWYQASKPDAAPASGAAASSTVKSPAPTPQEAPAPTATAPVTPVGLPEPTAPSAPPTDTQEGDPKLSASTGETRDSRSTKKKKTETATLKVRVVNWGYVWVDGVFKGSGPVTIENLAPGVHDVGAGQAPEKATVTEKVRLQPGGYLDHVIRLNGEMFK